ATLFCPSQPGPTALGCIAFGKCALWLELESKSRCYEILKNDVLTPMVRAVNSDPWDSSLHADLSQWYRELAKIIPNATSKEFPGGPRKAALEQSQRAISIDPQGKSGHLASYQLMLQFAERLTDERRKKDRQTLLNGAASALGQLVAQDPTDA